MKKLIHGFVMIAILLSVPAMAEDTPIPGLTGEQISAWMATTDPIVTDEEYWRERALKAEILALALAAEVDRLTTIITGLEGEIEDLQGAIGQPAPQLSPALSTSMLENVLNLTGVKP